MWLVLLYVELTSAAHACTCILNFNDNDKWILAGLYRKNGY